MRRRMFAIFASVSLLGCAAVCALWAMSYCEGIYAWDGRILVFDAEPGGMADYLREVGGTKDASLWWELWERQASARQSGRSGPEWGWWEWHGVEYAQGTFAWGGRGAREGYSGRFGFWLLVVPIWPFAALTLAVPAAWAGVRLVRAVRARRRLAGGSARRAATTCARRRGGVRNADGWRPREARRRVTPGARFKREFS